MNYTKILIMGLPGSGKTTLAKELSELIGAVHLNADEVRKNLNKDLGFSKEDRIEQARRMGWLCNKIAEAGKYVIADFICPTAQTRKAFGDCFLIFMDTIKKSKYKDTNKIFERPVKYDFIVKKRNARFYAQEIEKRINNKKYSLFIGRYQPLHKGHIALIKTVLNEGKDVLVALRETPMNKENPYSISERKKMFSDVFGERVKVISIPDISEVCYGRKVGWGVREIRLAETVENISATKIREQNKG